MEQVVIYEQNLSNTRKIELIVETSYNLFCGSSLLTLVIVKRGDVIVPGDLMKEREHWKSECEAATCEQTAL